MDNKVTAIDRLAELIKEYNFPVEALKNVISHIYLWQGNTNDDPYLWQEVRYFEEIIKQGYVTKRK